MEASDFRAPVGGALPFKLGVLCPSDCLIQGSHHVRFGDGLGWPASNRKYRDADYRLTTAVVAFVVLSRSDPDQLDETFRSGQKADRLIRHDSVCAEQIVHAAALLVAESRTQASGEMLPSVHMQTARIRLSSATECRAPVLSDSGSPLLAWAASESQIESARAAANQKRGWSG